MRTPEQQKAVDQLYRVWREALNTTLIDRLFRREKMMDIYERLGDADTEVSEWIEHGGLRQDREAIQLCHDADDLCALLQRFSRRKLNYLRTHPSPRNKLRWF